MEMQHFSDDEIRVIVENLGYEFVGLEIKRDPGRSIFRIYIDSLGGITLDDCETVSRAVTKSIEKKGQDLMDGRYYLEVSSPGIERPLFKLEDFKRFAGNAVSLRFRGLVEGRRRVAGRIAAVDEAGVIEIDTEKGPLKVAIESISSAKLVYAPEKPPKPHVPQRKKKKKKEKPLEGDS